MFFLCHSCSYFDDGDHALLATQSCYCGISLNPAFVYVILCVMGYFLIFASVLSLVAECTPDKVGTITLYFHHITSMLLPEYDEE